MESARDRQKAHHQTFPILSCFALTHSYIRGLNTLTSHKSIAIPFKDDVICHSVIVLYPTQTSLSSRIICELWLANNL